MAFSPNGNNKQPAGIPKWLVGLVDISLVNLGLYIAFFIVSGEVQGFQLEPLIFLLPLVSLATVFLFSSLGLYSHQRSSFTTILRALITGVVGLTLLSILFAFWTRAFIFERNIFIFAPLIQFALLLGWRILYWRMELWIHGQKKLLVIGNRDEVNQALEKLMLLPKGMFEVIKVLEPAKIEEFYSWLPQTEAVMVAGFLDLEQKNKIMQECFANNQEIFIVPDLYEIILTRSQMTQVHDTPMIESKEMQMNGLQLLLKRAFDLTLALLALPVVLVLLAVVAPAVRLSSPGPVIFKQERVGYRGKVFTLYKLRTMIVDAEGKSGPVFTSEEDDRVTGVGHLLRIARLDELPQLYNVLRGDLSIVGPRPERPYFVENFERELPEYKLRHLVKPGITGLAQVAGHYATNTRDKLRYDLYYVIDYSLLMDFRILLLTVPTLFNREAARGLSEEALGRLTWPKS
ncbi:MAG: sugar transferase [Bacillota bacterium]